MPRNPDGFTRTISFDRIGLHQDVQDLTIDADSEFDFQIAITRHAARYLSPTTDTDVDVHPDAPTGVLYARVWDGNRKARGPQLALLTVSLPATEA